MGNQNGSADKRSYTGRGAKRRQASTGVQILVSLLLIADLFLLYTMIMQLTHQQKAFEASPAVNWGLFAAFTLGAILLAFAVFRTGAWKRTLCLLLIFAALYLTAAFSQIPLIRDYRNIWISTAMSTMRHQGLATYYFPASVVNERVELEREAREAQIGDNTPDDTFLGDADEH